MEPMIWGSWPLLADLNNDAVTATGAVPDNPLGYEASTGDGEEGLKRRAACDECRTHHIVENPSDGADSMQGNAS